MWVMLLAIVGNLYKYILICMVFITHSAQQQNNKLYIDEIYTTSL